MRKYHKRSSKIVVLILLISVCFSSVYIINSRGLNAYQEITPTQTVQITVSSEPEALDEGGYLVNSEITFSLPHDGSWGASPTVILTLTGPTRAFPLTMTKTGTTWKYIWDSGPSSEAEAAPADTYTISLTVDGNTKDCSLSTLVLVNPPVDPMIIIIPIVIIAAVAVSALVIVKVKRGKDDVEFEKVDKTKSKKKKGEVYSGASSIGKRSGQIAESKGGSKTSVLDTPTSTTKSEGRHFKAIKGAFGVEKPTTTETKQMMPADSMFKFETKAAQSAAMVKSMELKMDLKSKVNFTTSKVNSIISNIEFFKAILLQQEQGELACPTCDKKANKYWIVCPYCELQEHAAELGLQQSLMTIGGTVGFCPSCKRVIQPSWSECPYCFAKDK